MGRTFGLVIVSIGLWLVFSLPTRAPVPDHRGTTLASTPPENTSKPASATAISAPIATVVIPDSRVATIRTTAADATLQARPSRTLGERNHAARSREIESEPEAAIQRPPEPVAVPMSAANLFAAGASHKSPSTMEQAIPMPIPMPIPVTRLDAHGPANPAHTSQPIGTTARNAHTISGNSGSPLASLSPPSAASATASTSQTAVKAPRIFEVVRRDLVASGHTSLATAAATSGPSALSVTNQKTHAPMAAAGANKASRSPSARAPEKVTVDAKASPNAPSNSMALTKLAIATSIDPDKQQNQTSPEAKAKDTKRDEAANPAKPAPIKPAPRIAAAPPLPRVIQFTTSHNTTNRILQVFRAKETDDDRWYIVRGAVRHS